MKTQFKTLVRKSDGQWMQMESDGNGTDLFEISYPLPFENSMEWLITYYSDDIDLSLYDLIEVAVIRLDNVPGGEDVKKEFPVAFPIAVDAINWFKSQIFKP